MATIQDQRIRARIEGLIGIYAYTEKNNFAAYFEFDSEKNYLQAMKKIQECVDNTQMLSQKNLSRQEADEKGALNVTISLIELKNKAHTCGFRALGEEEDPIGLPITTVENLIMRIGKALSSEKGDLRSVPIVSIRSSDLKSNFFRII